MGFVSCLVILLTACYFFVDCLPESLLEELWAGLPESLSAESGMWAGFFAPCSLLLVH